MIRCIVFGGFLILAAWQDLRRKQIDAWVFCVFGIAAAAVCADAVWLKEELGFAECLCGAGFGLCLLLIGRVSQGAIGAGDGLFFTIAGALLGLRRCLILFLGGTVLCGLYSLCYFTYKKLRHNVYAGKELLPFLPFAAAAGVVMLYTGGIS